MILPFENSSCNVASGKNHRRSQVQRARSCDNRHLPVSQTGSTARRTTTSKSDEYDGATSSLRRMRPEELQSKILRTNQVQRAESCDFHTSSKTRINSHRKNPVRKSRSGDFHELRSPNRITYRRGSSRDELYFANSPTSRTELPVDNVNNITEQNHRRSGLVHFTRSKALRPPQNRETRSTEFNEFFSARSSLQKLRTEQLENHPLPISPSRNELQRANSGDFDCLSSGKVDPRTMTDTRRKKLRELADEFSQKNKHLLKQAPLLKEMKVAEAPQLLTLEDHFSKYAPKTKSNARQVVDNPEKISNSISSRRVNTPQQQVSQMSPNNRVACALGKHANSPQMQSNDLDEKLFVFSKSPTRRSPRAGTHEKVILPNAKNVCNMQIDVLLEPNESGTQTKVPVLEHFHKPAPGPWQTRKAAHDRRRLSAIQ